MIRGEVRWYTFREPDKRRPVVILTRNSAIPYLTNLTVAPITSTVRNIPTEVLLTQEENGVFYLSAVNLDNIQTIQKAKIGGRITSLSEIRMEEIDRALAFALSLDKFL